MDWGRGRRDGLAPQAKLLLLGAMGTSVCASDRGARRLGQAWYAVVVHCVEPSTSAPDDGGGPALLRDQRPHARSRAASLGGTGRAAPPRRRRRCASAHQLRGVHANALLREGVPLNVSNANSDAARWA